MMFFAGFLAGATAATALIAAVVACYLRGDWVRKWLK